MIKSISCERICRMAQTPLRLACNPIDTCVYLYPSEYEFVRMYVCVCMYVVVAIGWLPLSAIRPKIGNAHARLSIALARFLQTK